MPVLCELLRDQAERIEREREQEDGGDPDRKADRERLERAPRDVAAALDRRDAEAGDRAELRADDHRPDDQDDLVGEDPDRRDQHRDHHEAEEARRELDVLRGPRLDLLPDDGVRGRRSGRCLRPLRRLGDLRVDLLHRDRALDVDLELAQVADDDARVFARDVAQDHVALGPQGRALEADQVAHRGRALEQLERVLCLVRGGHDPQVDHARLAYSRRADRLSPASAARRRRDRGASTSPPTTSSATSTRRARPAIAELGVSEHVYRFREALDVWRHPFWIEQATDDLGAYCEFVRTTPLRLGIEADFVPGSEDRIANLLESQPFDYVVGSIHFIGDVAVDDSRYDAWEEVGDSDAVWRRYFEMLAEAVRSGLFDILAHPDLVKVWGPERPWPVRDPRFYYEPAIEAIAETPIAVEVSTAGLRKPVGELYPSTAFCEMCVDAGASFALSSDAHAPEQVGYEYAIALELLADLGVEETCVFERRERRMEPLR